MAKMDQTTSNEVPTQSPDLSEILARLDSLETENKALKAQVNPENAFKKAKERYEGPRNYSYKMWGDVPVMSAQSLKKDKTKDYTYKNHLGQLISNQDLELTLADGSTTKVDVHEFNLNFSRSEKIPAEPITNGVSVTGYQFDVPEYGKFIVSASLIN